MLAFKILGFTVVQTPDPLRRFFTVADKRHVAYDLKSFLQGLNEVLAFRGCRIVQTLLKLLMFQLVQLYSIQQTVCNVFHSKMCVKFFSKKELQW